MKRGRASTQAKAAVKRKPAASLALKRPSTNDAESLPLRFLLRLVPGTYVHEDCGDEDDEDERRRWPWTDEAGKPLPSPYDGIYERLLKLPSDCHGEAVYSEISNPDKQLKLVESRFQSDTGQTYETYWWRIEFPERTGKDHSSLGCAHFSLSAEPDSDTKVVSAAEHAFLMTRPPLGRTRWQVYIDCCNVLNLDDVDVEVWLVDSDVPPGIPSACSAWEEYATRQALERRKAEVCGENFRKQLAETRRELLNARADRAALEAISPPALQMRVSPEESNQPSWRTSEGKPELYVFLRTSSLINGRFVYSAPHFKSDTAQDRLHLYYAETGQAGDKSGCGSWAVACDTKIRDALEDGTVEFCCASGALTPLGPHVEGEWGGWSRFEYSRGEGYFQRMRDHSGSAETPEHEVFEWSFQIEALTMPAGMG